MSAIKLKRVYDLPEADDGRRILVDRLWPRGLSRQKGKIDLWLKEIAPSDELRRWFGHEPARWPEFCERYMAELEGAAPLMEGLRKEATKGSITLLYAARDREHNNAVLLKRLLDEGADRSAA